MITALSFQIIYQALLTKACQLGLDKQYVNVAEDESTNLLKYQYIT